MQESYNEAHANISVDYLTEMKLQERRKPKPTKPQKHKFSMEMTNSSILIKITLKLIN